MKKIIATALLAATVLVLAGCGEKPAILTDSQKYVICIEAGGDWRAGAWGEEVCDLP